MQSRKIYLIERIHQDKLILIASTYTIRKAYEISLFEGNIAQPDISYKSLQRRLTIGDSVIMYDKSRFVSDTEAKYSPIGDVIRITRTVLIW